MAARPDARAPDGSDGSHESDGSYGAATHSPDGAAPGASSGSDAGKPGEEERKPGEGWTSRRGLRARMGAWAIGMDFAWTAVGGVLLGAGLDWILGKLGYNTSPVLLIVGMIGGLVGGFTVFVRAGLKSAREG